MAEAQSAIEAAGFTFSDGGVIDSDVAAGLVAGTDPAGGGNTDRGSTITVFTSNGAMKALPNVVGKALNDAKNDLREFNVKIVEKSDPRQIGRVISMEPGAGTPARPGDTVTIVVGSATGGNGGGADNGNGNGSGDGNG